MRRSSGAMRQGATVLPPLEEAIGLTGRLVDDVPVGAGRDKAEDLRPPGSGQDIARL